MIAYFDCFSGISGDMTLGALHDLGVPLDYLADELRSLPLQGFELSAERVWRQGISAQSVRVAVAEGGPSRHYRKIMELIDRSPLSGAVKDCSQAIFDRLATAEARIHGCPKEDVHFHEVGGIDAIVDIVGTALGIEYLGIQRVVASEIPVGRGFVQCAHGSMPVPAPATLGLLAGVPVYGTDIAHELVTPTGAAIIATLAEAFEPLPAMTVVQTGYGAGQRDNPERPNLLRIVTGHLSAAAEALSQDRVGVLETCIDDMNPEIFGYLIDRLLEDGALDVYYLPVFMKKNRPGTLVQVICPLHLQEPLMRRVLTETTTSGVRHRETRRSVLAREIVGVETPYGTLAVKRMHTPGGGVRWAPEYEVCQAIARERDIPIREVYDTVTRCAAAPDP